VESWLFLAAPLCAEHLPAVKGVGRKSTPLSSVLLFKSGLNGRFVVPALLLPFGVCEWRSGVLRCSAVMSEHCVFHPVATHLSHQPIMTQRHVPTHVCICYLCTAGGVVSGRYSRDMFSPEECRQRHADIISRLIAVFGLQGSSSGGGL
jgi:hypothetical protein